MEIAINLVPEFPTGKEEIVMADGSTEVLSENSILFQDGALFEQQAGDRALFLGFVDPEEIASTEFYSEHQAEYSGDAIGGYTIVDHTTHNG